MQRVKKLTWKHNLEKTKIMASGPITSWQIEGEKVEAVTDFIWGGSKITIDSDCSHEIKRCLFLENYDKSGHIKKQRHHFANKGLYSQSYGFSKSHVRIWEFGHKEGWVPKNWCFRIMLLKTWESFGLQRDPAFILWLPDAKNWLSGKDLDAGKDWRQKEKGWQRTGLLW